MQPVAMAHFGEQRIDLFDYCSVIIHRQDVSSVCFGEMEKWPSVDRFDIGMFHFGGIERVNGGRWFEGSVTDERLFHIKCEDLPIESTLFSTPERLDLVDQGPEFENSRGP